MGLSLLSARNDRCFERWHLQLHGLARATQCPAPFDERNTQQHEADDDGKVGKIPDQAVCRNEIAHAAEAKAIECVRGHAAADQRGNHCRNTDPVSYTHLTLPTICSV